MKKLVLNFKANLKLDEVNANILNYKKMGIQDKIIVCPSNIYLKTFIDNGYKVCAQDLSIFNEGAYTGEVTASQLKSIGVDYVLVGHYERRKYFKENDDIFSLKINHALKEDMKVIFCINSIDDLKKLKTITSLKNVILAYEPIESIGTNYVKSCDDLKKDIAKIKEIIYNQYCCDIEVMYGGSVDDDNIIALSQISNCDGFLVSNAALSIDKILKIEEVIYNK